MVVNNDSAVIVNNDSAVVVNNDSAVVVNNSAVIANNDSAVVVNNDSAVVVNKNSGLEADAHSDSVVVSEAADSVAVVSGSVGTNSDNEMDTYIELHKIVVATQQYNFQCARVNIPSKLNIEFWRQELADYEDNIVVDFLQFGWPINYCDDNEKVMTRVSNTTPNNHSSAVHHPRTVQDYIQTELNHGAIAGPFMKVPFEEGCVVSPLHTVPKKKAQTCSERRLVVDLSYPPGCSINDGIPRDTYLGEELCLEYPSVDRMCDMLVESKKCNGGWMLKRDLARAYRQLKVDPGDYNLLCFKWDNSLFFDTCLPFGLRTAAQACQRTTNALAFILMKRGVAIINYVDDLACVARSKEEAVLAGQLIDATIRECGLEVAEHKSVDAARSMTFLGVRFNADSMTMSVTPERMVEIRAELAHWTGKKKATKRELQSLVGKLQFIAKCCRPGRAFMARILAVLKSLKRQSHFGYL